MNSSTSRITISFIRCSLCATAFFAAVTFVSGCNKSHGDAATTAKSTSTNGTVAIVDLDRVSHTVGWADEISAQMKSMQADLQLRLESFSHEIQSTVERKKSQVAAEARLNNQQKDDLDHNRNLDKLPLSDAQKQDLAGTINQATQLMQAATVKANQLLQTRQQQVTAAYVEAIKPIVRRIAAAAGYSIVMTPSPSTVWFDSAVDITDHVTDEVQKVKPEHPLPPAPKLELPRVDLTPSTHPATTLPAVTLPPTTIHSKK